MASNPVAELLSTFPLFASLNTKERNQLARFCFEATLPAGTTIVRQGGVGVDCYILLSGEATVVRNDTVIATLSAGDLVGELAPLDHQPRSATVVAATDVRVLQIGARDLATALDTIPGLARKIMVTLARRVRDLDEQLLAG